MDQDAFGALAIIISMTAGNMVLVCMGDLITQYGVGQGVSIIIFGGIIARLPDQILQSFAAGLDIAALLIFGVLVVITVVAIICVYEGQRRMRQLEAQLVMRSYRGFIGTRTRQSASPLRYRSLRRTTSRCSQPVYV